MPRQETVIQLFVSSPSDVQEEREALDGIIQELNRIWSKNLHLRIELLRRETDIQPGFGADPQSVVNDDIGDEYDVFLGIFWGRIGTINPAIKINAS